MTLPRPTFRLMLCLLLGLCAAAAALAADESKDKRRPDESPPTTRKSPATKQTAQTHAITIKNSKFSPAALTIKPGETVVWTNDDDKDHAIRADDKSIQSDNISPDDEFEHTFAKPGTVKYACRYHPREKGTITVKK